MFSWPSISGNLACTVFSTLSSVPFLTFSIHVHGITPPSPACLFSFHFCAVGGLRQAVGSPVIQLQEKSTINLFKPQEKSRRRTSPPETSPDLTSGEGPHLLWGSLDQNLWFNISQIMVQQRDQWIHSSHRFIAAINKLRSEWSWITDPDADHPKGSHT